MRRFLSNFLVQRMRDSRCSLQFGISGPAPLTIVVRRYYEGETTNQHQSWVAG